MRRLKAGALLLLPGAAVVVLALYLSGSIPYRVFVIHTGSMSPTIPTGSAVLVRENRYRVGQAVAFRIHGTVITHRLVAVNTDGTIDTKGDADRSNDPWHARTADIIGEVVLAPHWLGYALVYLRQPLGAASVFLALLLAWQTWSLTGVLGRRPAAAASPDVGPAEGVARGSWSDDAAPRPRLAPAFSPEETATRTSRLRPDAVGAAVPLSLSSIVPMAMLGFVATVGVVAVTTVRPLFKLLTLPK